MQSRINEAKYTLWVINNLNTCDFFFKSQSKTKIENNRILMKLETSTQAPKTSFPVVTIMKGVTKKAAIKGIKRTIVFENILIIVLIDHRLYSFRIYRT